MAKHDFDFFHGSWHVHNRRLSGPDGWIEFEAGCLTRPLAAGMGFIDEMTFPTLGVSGHTIGLHDQARDQWAHYWVSSRDGVLQPPVYGGLTGPDTAAFHGEDELDGSPIKVRQLWKLTSPDVFVWEQAFELSSGWENNWIMNFTRL